MLNDNFGYEQYSEFYSQTLMFELEIWDLLILYFCITGMICATTASGLDTLQENVKM